MNNPKRWLGLGTRIARWLGIACLGASLAAAQTTPAQQPGTPAPNASHTNQDAPQPTPPETHITPEQARQLFALVDQLLQFSSQQTGLPIKHTVKRRLTTRAAVQKYLDQQFNDDKGAKRLQQDEIVLKKFGLLDRDFDLKPFLVALLKEQIEAYYDTKTKTVNLLDWVDPDEQKPVLAHELTHALQDQHSDLEKWDDQTPDDVSTNAAADQEHLAKDEMDTARDAVAEGQATAVMVNYILKPKGTSLLKDPQVVDLWKQQMTGSDSPVMSRAPLLLSDLMLFSYREGLSFEQQVWMDQGQNAAFAGALNRPPSSSWEIINPKVYEKREIPPIPLLPNIHPLLDKLYRPYDIGQVGQLDLHIMAQLLGGDGMAASLTPAWNGGLYWAGQLRSAKTAAEQNSTKSLALFYLSVWHSSAAAQVFAQLYGDTLERKYSQVKKVSTSSAPSSDGSVETVYDTDEGPVVITTRGKMMFVAESFPLPLARELTALILNAQGTGAMQTARVMPPAASLPEQAARPLSMDLIHLFQNCGVMKFAVDAEMRAAQ
ncbi:MAG: hypothetical protein ACLGPM_11395 [Acidobacteriota bacterium]